MTNSRICDNIILLVVKLLIGGNMKIKFYRQKLNMSQAKLADILGVSQTAVSKWEKGVISPRTNILKKLAELFGCSIDELVR